MSGLRYILGIVVILFSSCQDDLGSENFINLEDEYELYITQELSPIGGLASLEIKTSQLLNCSNYSIPYELIIESDHIDLTIEKVTIEGNCISEPTIITELVDFKLDNNNIGINISLQEVVSNNGTIQVSDDEISLRLNSNDGIKISKAKINRIPRNMMWGKIEGGKIESIDQVNAYLETIEKKVDIKKGDYAHFYINNEDKLQYYDSSSTSNSIAPQTFVFISETSLSKIEEKITEIKESDPTLVFKMTIYDGQTINIL